MVAPEIHIELEVRPRRVLVLAMMGATDALSLKQSQGQTAVVQCASVSSARVACLVCEVGMLQGG